MLASLTIMAIFSEKICLACAFKRTILSHPCWSLNLSFAGLKSFPNQLPPIFLHGGCGFCRRAEKGRWMTPPYHCWHQVSRGPGAKPFTDRLTNENQWLSFSVLSVQSSRKKLFMENTYCGRKSSNSELMNPQGGVQDIGSAC